MQPKANQDQEADDRERRTEEARQYLKRLSSRFPPRSSENESLHQSCDEMQDHSSHYSPRSPRDTSQTEDSKSVGGFDHSELLPLLQDYGESIAQRVSLQFRAESAKAILDRKIAEFNSPDSHHHIFPQIKESLERNIEASRKEYEELDMQVKTYGDGTLSAAKALANKLSSTLPPLYEGPHRGSQFADLEQMCKDRFRHMSEMSHQHRLNYKNIRDNYSRILSIQDDLLDLRRETSQHIGMPPKGWSQHSADLAALKQIVVGNEEKQIQGLKHSVEKFNDIDDNIPAKISILEEKVEVMRREQAAMMKKNLEVLAVSQTTQARDLTQTTSHALSLLEKRLSTLEAREHTTEPIAEANSRHSEQALESMNVRLTAMKAAQDAGDEYVIKSIQTLQGTVLVLAACDNKNRDNMDNIVQTNLDRYQEISAKIETVSLSVEAVDKKADSLAQVTPSSAVPTCMQASTVSNDANILLSQIGEQLEDKSNTIREQLRNTFADELKSLQMGVRSLDSRFSNLQTEQMARYILGQLQAFYPNLSTLEGTLCELRSGLTSSHLNLADNNFRLGGFSERFERLEAHQDNRNPSILSEIKEQIGKCQESCLLEHQNIGERLDSVEKSSELALQRSMEFDNMESNISSQITQRIQELQGSVLLGQQEIVERLNSVEETSNLALQKSKDLKEYIFKQVTEALGSVFADMDDIRETIGLLPEQPIINDTVLAASSPHKSRPSSARASSVQSSRPSALADKSNGTGTQQSRRPLKRKSERISAGSEAFGGPAPKKRGQQRQGDVLQDDSDDDYNEIVDTRESSYDSE